ncbi:MAG: hypothetical protein FWF22_09775, partial [Treponema sp.]|nr:hypothetical protein [Treponema sp.]
LENGPLTIREAAALMGSDIYNFNPQRLLAEGVVLKCGFTPTDAMHLMNDFSAYSREASLLAAKHIAFNIGITTDELCRRVYDEVKRRLYFEICRTLLEDQDRQCHRKTTAEEANYLIQKSYESAKKNSPDKMLSFSLKTEFPLVGLGAPIRVFLDEAAGLLGTRAIIPQYHEVANALGAVAGKIRASCTVEIRPDYSRDGITGYKVFGFSKNETFRKLAEAEVFAAAEAEAGARAELQKRGGMGEAEITVEQNRHEGKSKNGPIYMGSSVTAWAGSAFN